MSAVLVGDGLTLLTAEDVKRRHASLLRLLRECYIGGSKDHIHIYIYIYLCIHIYKDLTFWLQGPIEGGYQKNGL